jgi:hypothetical protein
MDTIDYTAMRAGTVTRRNSNGAAVCKIARCPKCGRKGELHAGVDLPGAVVDRYDHRAEDWGWAHHIDDSCTITVRKKERKATA